jgi:DNA-binding transcriptional MocR family regulator
MDMNKEAIFTLTLEQKLRDEFEAAAKASDQSPAEILQDMMRDFILQQKMAPDYLAFIQAKAATARRELAAEKGIPGEEVEQRFAAMRAAAAAKMR